MSVGVNIGGACDVVAVGGDSAHRSPPTRQHKGVENRRTAWVRFPPFPRHKIWPDREKPPTEICLL